MQYWSIEHVAPHVPQLFESDCRLEQVALFWEPSQSVRLGSQAHLPALQCRLFEHARPQAPQFASSVLTATHVPLHAVSSGPHIETHLLFEHRNPMSHAEPQAPQFAGSAVTSEHEPPQFVVFGGHEHLPAAHVALFTQTTPQPPQLFVSVCTSTHVPPQNVSIGEEQES